MIGPNVKTETLRDATSVVSLGDPVIDARDGLEQVFLGGEMLPNGNINGSRPRRFLAGSDFAERVVQSDVNVAAHDVSSLLCPHSPTARRPGLLEKSHRFFVQYEGGDQ